MPVPIRDEIVGGRQVGTVKSCSPFTDSPLFISNLVKCCKIIEL
jgi:hypothetical protein